MAALDRDTYMGRIKSLIGDRDDDEAISILDEFSSTYDDLADRSREDWREKYQQNDAEWRRKYKERFFSGDTRAETVEVDKETTGEEVKRDQAEDTRRDGTMQTFDQLFKRREG